MSNTIKSYSMPVQAVQLPASFRPDTGVQYDIMEWLLATHPNLEPGKSLIIGPSGWRFNHSGSELTASWGDWLVCANGQVLPCTDALFRNLYNMINDDQRVVTSEHFSVHKNGDIGWKSFDDDHTTVLQLHRELQEMADKYHAESLIDITSPNPSTRVTDQLIELHGDYWPTDKCLKHLTNGSLTNVKLKYAATANL